MTKPAAIDIPSAAPSDAGPKPKAGPMPRSSALQYLRAEKFARYSLLVIVVFIGAVFLNMVKVFFVPLILAAVFAGLFHPFYEWLVKLARGRRAISAFACCLVLSLGVLLPAYGVANLVAREAMRLYQSVQSNRMRTGRSQQDLGPRSVRLALEDVTLQGEWCRPAEAVGMVLFAHGSGSSRHSPRNQAVARALQESGTGTLFVRLADALQQR